MTSNPMIEGRRADSARRRQRVIKTINEAARTGSEMTISAIARSADVDRTFLYRHRDLLGQLHAAAAEPTTGPDGGPLVTRASLQADLAAAQERATRQAARIRQLERKFTELLGDLNTIEAPRHAHRGRMGWRGAELMRGGAGPSGHVTQALAGGSMPLRDGGFAQLTPFSPRP